MRLADAAGVPLEKVAHFVVPDRIAALAHEALVRVMDLAASTVWATSNKDKDHKEATTASRWTALIHQAATAATGFGGGMFGFASLALELPITTAIMFRSIA